MYTKHKILTKFNNFENLVLVKVPIIEKLIVNCMTNNIPYIHSSCNILWAFYYMAMCTK